MPPPPDPPKSSTTVYGNERPLRKKKNGLSRLRDLVYDKHMMKEKDFVREASRAGGAVYIVGGSVRDSLRGASPKDRDYVVCGLSEDVFCRLFPDAFKTGRAFPVYRLSIDGESREVAFARSETKTGRGYGGFAEI